MQPKINDQSKVLLGRKQDFQTLNQRGIICFNNNNDSVKDAEECTVKLHPHS